MDSELEDAMNREEGIKHAKGTSVKEMSLMEKFKRQPIFREKILYTASIFWSFIMLGWVESLFGPTLPDLRLIIDETLDTASWLLTATSAGYLVGSLITGLLYDRYNRLLLLVLSILGTSGTIAAIPWCPYFALMLSVKFLSGVMTSSLDTGGNAEIVSIWDKQAAPYMQALHFFFSLGGMIAPLMARSFLATVVDHKQANSSVLGEGSDSSITFFKEANTSYTHLPGRESDLFNETKVHYAYLISAVLILLTALPFLCIYYMKKDDIKRTTSVEKRTETSEFDKLTLPRKVFILCLLAMLVIVYCASEDTFAGFLMTFTISQLRWSKSAGSVATSVHWISFGIARLGAIFVVRFIQTTKLLYVFSIMLVVSFSCLLVATLAEITALVWVFIGCSGFSMSLIFPAILTWTNEHVIFVSGKISAMFLMSSSLGVMLSPLLFGYTMDNYSPMWFLYLLVGQSSLWVLIFTVVMITTKLFIKSSFKTSEVDTEEKESFRIEMT